MHEELERRAGKDDADDHPLDEDEPRDPSDYADPRVEQPGSDADASEAVPDERAPGPAGGRS